jgi:hypothetical protein
MMHLAETMRLLADTIGFSHSRGNKKQTEQKVSPVKNDLLNSNKDIETHESFAGTDD